jgi:hypothetical protein
MPSFRIKHIKTWEQYQKVVTGPELRSWAFRGQRDSGWHLESSISRLLKQYRIDPTGMGRSGEAGQPDISSKGSPVSESHSTRRGRFSMARPDATSRVSNPTA